MRDIIKRITSDNITKGALAVSHVLVALLFAAALSIANTTFNPFNLGPNNYYIYGIDNSLSMNRTIDQIRHADEWETIVIYLNSPGGYIHTMLQLIDAIEESKAHVIVNVDGFAMSAAAILAFTGDETLITDNDLFMFHLSRVMTHDGDVSILPLDDPEQVHFIDVLDRHAGKYLTDNEIRAILKGEDVFIPGSNMKLRVVQWESRTSNVTEIVADVRRQAAEHERVMKRMEEQRKQQEKRKPNPVVPTKVQPKEK